jgi:hypothetical protein
MASHPICQSSAESPALVTRGSCQLSRQCSGSARPGAGHRTPAAHGIAIGWPLTAALTIRCSGKALNLPHSGRVRIQLTSTPLQRYAGRPLKAEAARVVPWYITAFHGPDHSACKGRWLEIRHGFKVCYAQWEDAGPFRTDSAAYVFGGERPAGNANHGAGIDVSPAVRDYLGLRPLDMIDWRFVEQAEVHQGPWSLYNTIKNVKGTWKGTGAIRWEQ